MSRRPRSCGRRVGQRLTRPGFAPVVVATVALATVVAAGCGGEVGSGASSSTADGWDVELLHEIGSIDDPEQALTRVGEVLIAPDGRLLVAQSNDGYVRVHAVDGSFEGTIGRRGEGPGEFGRVGSMRLDSAGVWVHDGTNRRMHRFELDGTFLEDERWPVAREGEGFAMYLYGSNNLVRGPDGWAVAFPGMIVPAAPRGGGPPPDVPDTVPIRLLGPEGELGPTVVTLPSPFITGAPEGQLASLPVGLISAVPVEGDGFAWVERHPAGNPEPGTFRTVRVSVAGDTVFDRTWSYSPVPSPVEEIRAERESRLSESLREMYAGKIWVPETMPAVSDLVTASSGLIWIAREERQDPRTWWALDGETGRHVATIELPEGEEVVDQRGDDLVTRRLDAFDVEYLRRYRIRR